jgi:hypothetical protein
MMKKHERLSEALCEAVEFGRPTQIRMGHDDYFALLDSLDSGVVHKLDIDPPTFEAVSIVQEHDVFGCYVEHDNRYMAPSIAPISSVSETVVFMRDTKRPAIKAW